MFEVPSLAIQVISATLDFILVWYMIKPYLLTREERYLGLPLGFAFLGLAEIILGLGIIIPTFSQLTRLSLSVRAFAFVFMAVTYYFSKEPSRNSRFAWIISLSLTIVGFTVFWLYSTWIPVSAALYLRILELSCLAYICLHTLKSHIKTPESTTLWIPLGFIAFAISEYSQLIRATDEHYLYGIAFVGTLTARIIGLVIFVFVAYRTFYRPSVDKARGYS